jgi:Tol biopolymer transport system component
MRTSFVASSALLFGLAIPAAAQQSSTASLYDQAVNDWAHGAYPSAMQRLVAVLSASDGDLYLERTALLTGELFRTTEITTDGRAVRWSPSGNFASYEVGSNRATVTRILEMKAAPKQLAEVRGSNLVFAPGDQHAAYIGIREPQNDTVVVLRDLATQQERVLADRSLRVTSMTWADGKTLIVAATESGDARKSNLYSLSTDGGTAVALAAEDSAKTSPIVVPGGRYVLFTVSAANAGTSGGRGGRGGGGGGAGGGRGGAPGRPPMFGVLDLQSRTTKYFNGTSLSVAANGSAVAFLTRNAGEFAINVLSLTGADTAVVVRRSTDSLAAPALSPSGKVVAYQMMTEHDWDVYAIARDGGVETRVTRDIQHDLQPRFLDDSTIFAVQGEARHRRSFMYDLKSLTRRRLFDNNTVRTIAPEYEWAPSPNGTRVLIVAERDGDTVSPERGVYIMDLTQRLTKTDVLDRLKRNLGVEQRLRANGVASFKLLGSEVKRVVAEVSTDRIFAYEKTLFDFDSKHITRPGNAKARQFLFDTYKSFGYEPVMQEFEAAGRGGQAGIKTANVYVTLKGTVNPELIYVVGAHFDSRAEGPGADDNTSGTVELLEAARVLAKHPLPATVVFVSFTGEEAGLLGSREFVRQAAEKKWKIVGALNNDMIGWANDQRLDNTIRYSNPGIRDIQHAAAMQFSNLITYDALYYKSTDAAAFYDGWGDIVGGIGSYPVLGNPHYHMPHDNLEYENHQLIAEVGKTTAATIMLLASSPSRLTGVQIASYDGKTAEVKWTPSPEKGVKKYVVAWGSDVAASSTAPAALAATAARSVVVSEPRAKLTGIAPGTTIAVKAINDRGLEGWDWARVVAAPAKTGVTQGR